MKKSTITTISLSVLSGIALAGFTFAGNNDNNTDNESGTQRPRYEISDECKVILDQNQDTLNQYRDQIHEIMQELRQAELDGDDEQVQNLREQIKSLHQQIQEIMGDCTPPMRGPIGQSGRMGRKIELSEECKINLEENKKQLDAIRDQIHTTMQELRQAELDGDDEQVQNLREQIKSLHQQIQEIMGDCAGQGQGPKSGHGMRGGMRGNGAKNGECDMSGRSSKQGMRRSGRQGTNDPQVEEIFDDLLEI